MTRRPESIISLRPFLGDQISGDEEISLEILQKLDRKRQLMS